MEKTPGKAALFSISYGLYIVSSNASGKRSGYICNTLFQVTTEPDEIAFCCNKNNFTHELVMKSRRIAVSVLEQDSPMDFIGKFGFKSGRDIDKFEGIAHEDGIDGCPIVTEHAVSVFECRVLEAVDVGKHTLFIAAVEKGRTLSSAQPLTYAHYRDKKKGRSPANAPTYRGELEGAPPAAPIEAKRSVETEKWICDICAYEYDPAVGDPDHGIPPGTPFEKLPADWTCPVCGTTKDNFSKLG